MGDDGDTARGCLRYIGRVGLRLESLGDKPWLVLSGAILRRLLTTASGTAEIDVVTEDLVIPVMAHSS